MNIALIGYGRMGKEIEAAAKERNHEIPLIIDIDNSNELNEQNLKNIDVAIEFTIPESAFNNIMTCFNANVPVVSGTTGWLDNYETVKSYCDSQGKTFFYAPNYSIGVNILFKVNAYLAKIMNNFSNYEVGIEETHHKYKLDSPSGTAIKLANDIIQRIDRKKLWEEDTDLNDETINIHAIREDNIPGIHTITYDSDIDSISLTHSAKSRKGFALGAVMAAEFTKDKSGLYSMDDLLQID